MGEPDRLLQPGERVAARLPYDEGEIDGVIVDKLPLDEDNGYGYIVRTNMGDYALHEFDMRLLPPDEALP